MLDVGLGRAAGECGLRGGYVEFTNFHPGTVDELYKIASGEDWATGWLGTGLARV